MNHIILKNIACAIIGAAYASMWWAGVIFHINVFIAWAIIIGVVFLIIFIVGCFHSDCE